MNNDDSAAAKMAVSAPGQSALRLFASDWLQAVTSPVKFFQQLDATDGLRRGFIFALAVSAIAAFGFMIVEGVGAGVGALVGAVLSFFIGGAIYHGMSKLRKGMALKMIQLLL